MIMNYVKFIILSVLLGLVASSCNKDKEDISYLSASNSTVIVSSFSLTKDTKILPGLDSVYFSIDLGNAEVFNADSLPYGTDVSRLIPVIGTAGCSVAELHFKSIHGNDTVVDYLTHSTDSINFANGPVTLHLVANDGITERDYQLKVNVHQMVPDSLYWNRTARRSLPVLSLIPARQKTVKINDKYLCLTAAGAVDNQTYNMACIDDLQHWNVNAIQPESGADFPANLDITTLVAGEGVLYILDQQGELYLSDEVDATLDVPGTKWRDTGVKVEKLYGTYGRQALGCVKEDGKYNFVTYPAGTSVSLPDDFPVSGTSDMIDIDTKWSSTPQKLMIGGRKADGKLTGAVWGYDGKSWARISRSEVPAGEGKTMFLYSTFTTDSTNWSVTEYPTLFAFGGRSSDGVNDASMYISRNMGITWTKGDDLVQMPSYIPAMAQAQAFVAKDIMRADSRSGDSWDACGDKPLPRWCKIATPPLSRAMTPITEWDAPMIYLFGGVNDYGTLYNTVWRGAINRLTFKPLQ